MMRVSRSWLDVVGAVLGGLGAVACLAAIVLAWVVSARLRGTVDRVFDRMETSLATVDQRLLQAKGRIDVAKITTADIETTLRDRAKVEVEKHASFLARADEQAGRLAVAVDQADDWLESSESWVALVRERLSMSAATGVAPDTPGVDRILETIASMRQALGTARECALEIRERIPAAGGTDSRDDRAGATLQLAGRAAATLGVLDGGLARLASGLTETRAQCAELRSRTRRWILIGAFGVTLLFAWMGAGQVALWRLSRRRQRA